MSLEKFNEDGKPTETKSSQQPTQEPQKPKKQEDERVAYFSRELMLKEAERIRREYNQTRKLQQQEDMAMEIQEMQEPEIIIPELDEIERWARGVVQDLSEDTENAKNNQRVMIMATSVIKMCQLLQNYSMTMKSEMEKIAERELQNLNLQEQYAKSVKASTVEVTRDIYHQFKNEQTVAFREVQKYLYDTCDDMEKEMIAYIKYMKTLTITADWASKEISKSVKRFCTVRTIGDLLYYAAPVAVVIDVLLRLFDFI